MIRHSKGHMPMQWLVAHSNMPQKTHYLWEKYTSTLEKQALGLDLEQQIFEGSLSIAPSDHWAKPSRQPRIRVISLPYTQYCSWLNVCSENKNLVGKVAKIHWLLCPHMLYPHLCKWLFLPHHASVLFPNTYDTSHKMMEKDFFLNFKATSKDKGKDKTLFNMYLTHTLDHYK